MQKDLFDLARELCTVPQVKALLWQYKDELPKGKRNDILIGSSEEEVIANLKRAVKGGLIPAAEVHKLVQKSEENGNQHVFFFKPTKPIQATVRDGESVAELLFGADWKESEGFPKVDLVPETTTWADFRVGLPGKPRDWLGKLYRLERHERFLKVSRTSKTQIHRVYNIVHERNIVIVRWNDPDLLEIRLDRSENKSVRSLQRRLTEVWSLCADAFSAGAFSQWNVKRVVTKLLEACATDETKEFPYIPADTVLLNPDGTGIELFSDDSSTSLFKSARHRATTKDYIAGNAVCRQSAITWLAKHSEGTLSEDLSVYVGGVHDHEIIIRKRVESQEIDYVTNQLRKA